MISTVPLVDATLPRRRRRVLAWLPASSGESGERYPVIYMHDGHNLFDEAASYAEAWRADLAMTALETEGIEAIVVGIPNAGDKRSIEYSPWPARAGESAQGADYIEFVVSQVKPFVDASLPSQPDRLHTALVGSSLGANISLYGFFAKPDVFGLAGALSPALWFGAPRWEELWRSASHVGGRLYMDIGGREQTDSADPARWLDAYNGTEQAMREMGYLPDEFTSVFDPGGRHDEASWRRRLPGALRFLLHQS